MVLTLLLLNYYFTLGLFFCIFLQNSKSQLSSLIEERERYLLEINKKDSTTTSKCC